MLIEDHVFYIPVNNVNDLMTRPKGSELFAFVNSFCYAKVNQMLSNEI